MVYELIVNKIFVWNKLLMFLPFVYKKNKFVTIGLNFIESFFNSKLIYIKILEKA